MGNENTKSATLTDELTDEQLELLIANTKFNRFMILEWYEGFMNDCPTGRLDRGQFAASFQQLYPSGDATKYSEYVFNTFDLDKNGYISFHEFLLAISALSSVDGDLKYRLHMLFKMYDLNSSGGIDAKELEKVIEALFDLKGVSKETRTGENTAVGRVRSIFTKFDKDHSQDLSEDEFVNGFLEDELVMAILVPTDQ